MKITNKHNLPASVFNFISEDRYSPGSSDYSVTTLLRPPQMVQLERRHWHELEEDAMDRVWSVFGTAVHNLLESHAHEDAVVEERLYIEVGGRKIGGQIDNYHDGVITDYKVTSAWTLVYGSRIKEWEEQQNIYAHILKANGYPVHGLQICAILRDWDKKKAQIDPSYPQAPLVMLDLTLWPSSAVQHLLEERVELHVANETLDDAQLFPCSAEEMWEQATKYAVMKEGGKRAVRVLDSQAEAEKLVSELLGPYTIEIRQGKRTRCEEYCACAKFCCQFKEYQCEVSSRSE